MKKPMKVNTDFDRAIKAELAKLPGMIKRLHDHYGPIVHARCSAHNIVTEVGFIEAMPQVQGLRFALVVRHKHSMPVCDLRDLCQALEHFTCWEDAGFKYEGYSWRLGDGDDAHAVYTQGDAICIWARGWKE